jgi:hypothetical protein
MANNCYNFIEIKGSEEEVKDFAKLLDLNATQENGCEVYANLLTKFCDGEIGDNAKWFDLESDQIEGDDTYLKISGDTAWSPSLDLFGKISERYPSFIIRYEYEEMGNDFSGWADIENGEIQDNCFPYWEGQIAMDYSNALDNAIGNELSCYDTEAELLESDMYKAFGEDAQKELLENYKG